MFVLQVHRPHVHEEVSYVLLALCVLIEKQVVVPLHLGALQLALLCELGRLESAHLSRLEVGLGQDQVDTAAWHLVLGKHELVSQVVGNYWVVRFQIYYCVAFEEWVVPVSPRKGVLQAALLL